MTKFKFTIRRGITKEIAMAALLFCLPLLIPIHLLFDEYHAITLDLFGFGWTHGFPDDQVFSWVALSTAISWIYLFLFYRNSEGLVKCILQLFIWYLLYNFLMTFFPSMPGFFHQPGMVLVSLGTIFLWSTMKFFESEILRLNVNFKGSRSISLFYAFVILLAFFIKTCNEFVPSTLLEVDLGFIVVGSFRFTSFETFLWILGFKLGLLLPLLVWFFMEKKWWRYALLSPILLTIYQLRTVLNSDTDIMDQHEFFQALPLLTFIALVLVALSKNVKSQYVAQSIYEKASLRIEKLLEQRNQKHLNTISDSKRRLTTLKKQRTTTAFNDLMQLKKQLENELGER